MKNKINDNKKSTNRGIILELIFDICASEAALCHDYETLMLYELDLKEKEEVNKTIISTGESSPEVISEIKTIKEKISLIDSMIKLETETRRRKQDFLESLIDNLDKRFHCKLKHWARVIEHDLELLESCEYDDVKEIINKDFEIFASTISLYTGIEYSDCYRCISDKLNI